METLPLLYAFCLKQKPLQTSEKRLTAVVLAPPARLELTTFRLGEEPNELNQMQRNTKKTSNIKAFPALPYIQSTTKIKPKQG